MKRVPAYLCSTRIYYCLISLFGLVIYSNCAFAQLINYSWQQEFVNDPQGRNELTFLWKLNNLKATAGDLYARGRADFIFGSERGELSYFENQGSDATPNLVLKELRLSALVESTTDATAVNRQPLFFGARAAPALINLYNDGIWHLIVGNADGELTLVANRGTRFNPVFTLPYPRIKILPDEALKALHIKNLVPATCDLNNNGVTDLLLGTADGRVLGFYGRISTGGRVVYNSTPNFVLTLTQGKNASPTCVELGQEATKSILVGENDGYLTLFRNTGGPFHPKFDQGEFFFDGLDVGGETAPFSWRVGNQKFLLLSNYDTKVRLYNLRNFEQSPSLWSVKENILRVQPLVNLGKKLNFTSGPLFGGPNADLLIGSEKGNLVLYRNKSQNGQINLVKETDNLLGNIDFPVSAPELGDLNGDGLQDLLLAEKNGRIHYFTNVGNKSVPKFQIAQSDIVTLPGVLEPIPRLLPNPQTGLLDLVIGSSNHAPLFYKNIGTKNLPKFESTSFDFITDSSSEYGGNLYQAPAIFNWNKSQVPNLVIGRYGGVLQVLSYNPQKSKEFGNTPLDFQEYLSRPFRVTDIPLIEELQFIRPYFFDILGRGKDDLILSNENGEVLLFLQEDASKLDPKTIYREYLARKLAERRKMIEETRKLRKPIIVDPIFQISNQPVVNGLAGRHPVPDLGELYGNKLADLVVGFADGRVEIYKNTGTQAFWNYSLAQTLHLPNNDKNAAPLMVDLYGHGLKDLVLGSASGRIYYFRNVGTKYNPSYIYDPSVFKTVRTNLNAIPSYFFTQHKALPDLIFGDLNGRLQILSNLTGQSEGEFGLTDENYLNLPASSLSVAPRIFDINNDGSPKLVLANDQGEIKFYQLSPDQKKWVLIPNLSPKMNLPYGAVPAFGFLRDLGVPDMIVGLDDGRLLFFRNDAVTQESLKKMEDDLVNQQ